MRQPTPRDRRGSDPNVPIRLADSRSGEFDLYERDGEYVLSVEMPGFEVENIKLAWDDGRLQLAAEQHDDRRDDSRTFRRTFRVQEAIDEDGIRARYKRGILDVYLPTLDEPQMPGREIPVDTDG